MCMRGTSLSRKFRILRSTGSWSTTILTILLDNLGLLATVIIFRNCHYLESSRASFFSRNLEKDSVSRSSHYKDR